LDQGLGQVRRAHAFLHSLHIVRHTPELHHVVLEIGDGEGRTWVSVARLPN
jgi:tRNA G46 methylase TrmB